ncbi:hypothetical protein AKJ16_DCAP16949, partial [Drosera capensis]
MSGEDLCAQIGVFDAGDRLEVRHFLSRVNHGRRLGATWHVTRERGGYADFRRIPMGSQRNYMGNDTREDVLRVDCYELPLNNGRTLQLHDVLYILGV